jgi:hypothetical protein
LDSGQLLVLDGVIDGGVLRVGQDPTAELVDLRRTERYHYLVCPGSQGCMDYDARTVRR